MSPLNPTQPDYHARMSAGAKLMTLVEAMPPKTSAPDRGPAQVAVVIEMPEWARSAPRQATAKVLPPAPPNPA